MGFPLDPKMTLEEFVASVKPEHDLTDEELYFVLARVEGRVKRRARRVWEQYDRPKSVKPDELCSEGLFGWAQAWQYRKENRGNFIALGEDISRKRMLDEIRRLVTRKVRRPDGTYVRVLTEKSIYAEPLRPDLDDHQDVQRYSGEGDFTDRVDARTDFDAAFGSEDERDRLVTLILAMADGRVFAVKQPKVVEAIRKLLSKNGNDPRKVIQDFFPAVWCFADGSTALNPSWMSPAEIEERLTSVGRHIREKTRLDDAPSFLERVRGAFEGERMFSKALAGKLGMSVADLAAALKPYGIRSRHVQIGEKHHRGYLLADVLQVVPSSGESEKKVA